MERTNYREVDGTRREVADGGAMEEEEEKGDAEQKYVEFHFVLLLEMPMVKGVYIEFKQKNDRNVYMLTLYFFRFFLAI